MRRRRDPIPPHDTDAEQSVLGAALESRDAMAEVAESLQVGDFYHLSHQTIWEAMIELFGRGEPVDVTTLAAALARIPDDKQTALEVIGGKPYLAGLIHAYPVASAAGHYARIVADLSTRRRLIQAASKIAALAHDEAAVDKALDQAEAAVFSARGRRFRGQAYEVDALVDEFVEIVEHREQHELTGIPSGFSDLDALTGGWQDGQLAIVAARPGMGKTALLDDAALKAGALDRRVLFFSLEMGRHEIAQRLLASVGNVASQGYRTGRLSQPQWSRTMAAVGKVRKYPITVVDAPDVTIMEMRARARRTKDVGLIMLDYLQLMRLPGKWENRTQEVSEISRGLKMLAREMDVPVIAAAQLNRQLEYRQDKHPLLADLRESGALEQDADLVMFLYREEAYDPKPENAGKAELNVAKQRNGPTGVVNLHFRREFTTFRPVAADAETDAGHGRRGGVEWRRSVDRKGQRSAG